MCGVFGYIGKEKKDLSGFLLKGLSKLEYRGYDSSGIAVYKNEKPRIFKEVGEIKNLKKLIGTKKIAGSVGIGHTRWATHGGVTKRNSHPHTDCSGKIVVVHNGIVENFESIKEKLLKKGHKFKSQTDTEVFAHLVEENYKGKATFSEAVRKSFNSLEGLNAVVAVSPDQMIAFRKGSPLIVGVGKNANYISSDIPALISVTKNLILLNEGDGALLSKKEVKIISSKTGKSRHARSQKVEMEEVVSDKGNFEHFLLKEIMEEPEVVMRVSNNGKDEIKEVVKLIKKAWGTYFTACGTAAHAGLAATYLFSEIAKRHVNFSFGSEFPYFQDFLVPKSLLIAASQSGETMDTLEAVKSAQKHNSKVLALVNVPGSSLSRLADKTIYLKAGPERAVLSTKAYIAKLSLFLLLAYSLDQKYKKGVEVLRKTARQMSKMLKGEMEKKVKTLAKRLKDSKNIYIIGRGVNYATALEGALKIKEASYIHAEGFAGGELKHGVIALVEKGTPCIAIVANDRAKESILSNAMEMKTRGGYIVGIAPQNEKVFDYWIKVPDIETTSSLLSIVPLQLLAYYLTILKGYNPDRPRNLAKSVTVK